MLKPYHTEKGVFWRFDKIPRQARLDTPGTLHHVIIRGIKKKPIVGDVKDRNDYGTPISEVARCVGVTTAAVSKMINPVIT